MRRTYAKWQKEASKLRIVTVMHTKTNQGKKYISTNENDVLFSNDTGILGKRNSEFSQQESNLRPSDYQFGRSTTELQETRGS